MMQESERPLSPVSSLGPDAEEQAERDGHDEGSYLERIVSPVQEDARTVQAQQMQSLFPVTDTSPSNQAPTEEDNLLPEERDSFPAPPRPGTERRSSRSSLPSQQRPALDSRQTSWGGAWGSRRGSQVLEPATEGVATPYFGTSRRNSIERFTGYGDSPPIQRDAAMSHQGEYFPPDEQSAVGMSMVSDGPYAEYDPADSTMAIPASSDVQQPRGPSPDPSTGVTSNLLNETTQHDSMMYGQAISTTSDRAQQYGYLQPPVLADAPPISDYPSQAYTYATRPVSANAPPQPMQQDSHPQRFSPAVLDARQQSAEYQLSGVGPPEDTKDRGALSRGGGDERSGQSHSQTTLNGARINPNSIMERQPTLTGDEFPQGGQEKKGKRRSSFFGAFSRSSSISDGWQSRLPSRGSTTKSTPTNTDPSTVERQSRIPPNAAALVAAQRERDIAAKSKTLQKSQRSSPSVPAVVLTPDPEKKERRFSRLGSIFGRRNSQASDAKKANKLVKPMPRSQAPASTTTRTQGSRDNISAQNSLSRRSQSALPIPPPPPPAQVQAMYHHQRGLPPSQENIPQLPAAWTAPPPGGWYAPSGRPSSYTEQERQQQQYHQQHQHQQQQQQQQQQNPTLPAIGPPGSFSPQKSTRRLHSEGFRREPRYMTASPGPNQPPTSRSPAPMSQEGYYSNGSQDPQPEAQVPDSIDRRWEQAVAPQPSQQPFSSGSAPLPIPQPRFQYQDPQQQQQQQIRQQQRPGPSSRPLSGNWQRQNSYGSDTGPHFDNFSSYGTPPPQRPGHIRQNSYNSDNGGGASLTPTHSRTASFGAAPKTAYRMSAPMEGEQMLQRDFESSLSSAHVLDPNYFSDRGAYPAPSSVASGMYEPNSASSSPVRRRDGQGRAQGGMRYPPQQQQQQQQRAQQGGYYLYGQAQGPPQYPQQRQYGTGASLGNGYASPVQNGLQTPPRRSRTPVDSRAGSRRNSLVMIDEDHPYMDSGHPPLPPQMGYLGPGMGQGYPPPGNYGRGQGQGQMQRQMQGQGQGQGQAQPFYNANAERRRVERRESGGAGRGAGYAYGYAPQEQAGWYASPAQMQYRDV